MVIETEDCKVAWDAVGRIPVDVVKLNMLPLPANAASMIVGRKQLGGNFVRYVPTTHLGQF